MGKASREKGKRGEREFARWIASTWGVPARRGQQFRGSPESPDIVIDDFPGVHFEVKRTERVEVYKALEQAISECKPDEIAVVAHRRNNGEWTFIMRGADAHTFARNLADLLA